MNPLALSAQAVADATGKLTVTLPAPSLGTWWQAAVVVPTAPTGATLGLYLAGSKELSWIGPQPSASVVVLASQTVKVEGSGFTAGDAYSVNVRGGWASGSPQGIAPAGPSSFAATTLTGTVTAKITGPVTLAAGTTVDATITNSTLDITGPVTVEGSSTTEPGTAPTFSGRTVSASQAAALLVTNAAKTTNYTVIPAPAATHWIELHSFTLVNTGTVPLYLKTGAGTTSLYVQTPSAGTKAGSGTFQGASLPKGSALIVRTGAAVTPHLIVNVRYTIR